MKNKYKKAIATTSLLCGSVKGHEPYILCLFAYTFSTSISMKKPIHLLVWGLRIV